MISTHIRTEGFYVKTAIIHQLKRLCAPDCACTESKFIHFIHISLYDISVMQNILYQIKRDVTVWKRLGCLQRKQRTWWQIKGNIIYGVIVIGPVLLSYVRYIVVEYNTILSIITQGVSTNFDQAKNSQKTVHTPPLRARYGRPSFVNYLEKSY